ncbi:MAG: electron transfer flavoprotein-ubiquinone oxidoreductase [Acidobacteriota bacterium]|nr:MAG: electron transfer flavoprotein-ubiquinone oxidoreductase [Acidobacteriota bacterium]
MNAEIEREQLEVDVLLVGGGPASLSAAYHLSRLVETHNEAVSSGKQSGKPLEPVILVIEKGKEIGAHGLSGAVVDPRGFDELLADDATSAPPYDCPVTTDSVHFLTEKRSFRFPVTPPPLRNHGNYLASLGRINRWLGDLCEQQGVEVYAGFPATELLLDGDRVIGARMADSGVGADGQPRDNFEPGMDVIANLTILGEGPRGTLLGQAQKKLGLQQDRQPQIYALGVKEVWKTDRPLEPGQVYHTLGFPLGTKEFGGGFIYTMNDGLIHVGFVAGLDYADPRTDGHRLLQEFKKHPFVEGLLDTAELVAYGAKAIPEGGYYAMPQHQSDGLLITGDSGGFLNAQRLKGIHLAVKSGMLAAETAFEALIKEDFSSATLGNYSTRVENSWIKEELWPVRNFRQAYQSGFWKGVFHTGIQFLTGGRGLKDPLPITPGHEMMQRLEGAGETNSPLDADGKLTFDKLSSVYFADTSHEEDQPSHLKVLNPAVCVKQCAEEFGNPCQYFCPANVYEILSESVSKKLRINFSNCVHCKTCEIMDPYQVILWTPPEGGGGPDWKGM